MFRRFWFRRVIPAAEPLGTSRALAEPPREASFGPGAQAIDLQEQADARMNNAGPALSELSALLGQRLALVGTLATSLGASRLALLGNDAEAIARGAAHQAELCRQWSQLEHRLRSEAARHLSPRAANFPDRGRAAQLDAEWQGLCKRIRYLTRVHGSLLKHMQRSLGILQRVVDSCAPTYRPAPGLVAPGLQPGRGNGQGE